MIKIENLCKTFRTTEVETIALNNVSFEIDGSRNHRTQQRQLRDSRQGICSHYGSLRMRQVYPTEHYGTARQPDFGRLLPRHEGSGTPQGERPHQRAQGKHRLRVPKLQPDRRTERGGERRARAVVSNPKIILADEPTGNLDSKNGQEVMELLTELNKEGTTIVMVTHSQRDAGYAERIINLFDGQIVASISEM